MASIDLRITNYAINTFHILHVLYFIVTLAYDGMMFHHGAKEMSVHEQKKIVTEICSELVTVGRKSEVRKRRGSAGRLRRSEKLIKKISDQQSRPVRVQSLC